MITEEAIDVTVQIESAKVIKNYEEVRDGKDIVLDSVIVRPVEVWL